MEYIDNMSDSNKGSFTLQGAGEGFKDRSTDVFGCLDVIEDKHIAVEKAQQKDNTQVLEKDDQTDAYIGSSSGSRDEACKGNPPGESSEYGSSKTDFKVPKSIPHGNRSDFKVPKGIPHGNRSDFKVPKGIPHGNRSRRPDFKARPDKWTFYNLTDVDNSKMNEQSNRSAALSFLDELKKRKAGESTEDGDQCPEMSGKVLFKKPKLSTNKTNDGDDHEAKSKVICGKVVMPEYSFKTGTKQSKISKKTPSGKKKEGNPKGSSVKLGHLDEDDEDET